MLALGRLWILVCSFQIFKNTYEISSMIEKMSHNFFKKQAHIAAANVLSKVIKLNQTEV